MQFLGSRSATSSVHSAPAPTTSSPSSAPAAASPWCSCTTLSSTHWSACVVPPFAVTLSRTVPLYVCSTVVLCACVTLLYLLYLQMYTFVLTNRHHNDLTWPSSPVVAEARCGAIPRRRRRRGERRGADLSATKICHGSRRSACLRRLHTECRAHMRRVVDTRPASRLRVQRRCGGPAHRRKQP